MFIHIHLTSQSFIRAVLLQVISSSQEENKGINDNIYRMFHIVLYDYKHL